VSVEKKNWLKGARFGINIREKKKGPLRGGEKRGVFFRTCCMKGMRSKGGDDTRGRTLPSQEGWVSKEGKK